MAGAPEAAAAADGADGRPLSPPKAVSFSPRPDEEFPADPAEAAADAAAAAAAAADDDGPSEATPASGSAVAAVRQLSPRSPRAAGPGLVPSPVETEADPELAQFYDQGGGADADFATEARHELVLSPELVRPEELEAARRAFDEHDAGGAGAIGGQQLMLFVESLYNAQIAMGELAVPGEAQEEERERLALDIRESLESVYARSGGDQEPSFDFETSFDLYLSLTEAMRDQRAQAALGGVEHEEGTREGVDLEKLLAEPIAAVYRCACSSTSNRHPPPPPLPALKLMFYQQQHYRHHRHHHRRHHRQTSRAARG